MERHFENLKKRCFWSFFKFQNLIFCPFCFFFIQKKKPFFLEIRSKLLFPPKNVWVPKNTNWRKNQNFCPPRLYPGKKNCLGGGVRIWIQHFWTRVTWREALFFVEGKVRSIYITYPRYVSTCFHIFYVLLRNLPLLWMNCRSREYLEYFQKSNLFNLAG